MTVAAAQLREWIEREWPTTPISRFACRDTASGGISQHSAYGSPRPSWSSKDDSNALDVFGPGKTSGPEDQAHIQAIVDTINADGRWKWSIRQIVWKDGGAHENHCHIDFYPKATTRKWCGNGTPSWAYKDGSVIWSRNPDPENGRYDGDGSEPIDPPDGGDEDMEQYVTAQQENLNAAGFTDFDDRPLVVDGVYGPRTQSAEAKRDAAAAESSQGGFQPHTHDLGTGTPI